MEGVHDPMRQGACVWGA